MYYDDSTFFVKCTKDYKKGGSQGKQKEAVLQLQFVC